MSFSVRNPILARIEDNMSFIKSLLDNYPTLLTAWEKNQQKIFQKQADKIANGDQEVRKTILNDFYTAFDNVEDMKNLFYQSVFLMAYSYYDASLGLFEGSIRNNVIKNKCKHLHLKKETLKNISFIYNTVRPLRNHICHNNSGSYDKDMRIMMKIVSGYNDIHYEDKVISFSSDSFINTTLEKIYSVLKSIYEYKLNI